MNSCSVLIGSADVLSALKDRASNLEGELLAFTEGDALDFEQLQATRSPSAAARTDDWFNPDFTFPMEGFSLEEAINRLIQHGLGQTAQNVSAAARLLGVSRDYLRYRLSGKQPEKTGN